jgi:hypothetical protein
MMMNFSLVQCLNDIALSDPCFMIFLILLLSYVGPTVTVKVLTTDFAEATPLLSVDLGLEHDSSMIMLVIVDISIQQLTCE